MFAERQQSGAIFCRMRWMNHFDPIESHCGQSLEALVTAVLTRVREHRDTSAAVDQFYGFRNRNTSLVHVRWSAGSQVTVKGVAQVHGPPILHHRARNVWATDRSVSRDRDDVLERDTDAESIEQAHDPFGAITARFAKNAEGFPHLVQTQQVKSENVNLVRAFVRGEFDARDKHQPHGSRRFARRGNPVHGVVIGQRQRLKPGLPCRRDNNLRRVGPIGRRRMEMEIDMPRVRRGGAGHGV